MSLHEHDELPDDAERDHQRAYLSTREATKRMHHPQCTNVTDEWSWAPAPLLKTEGFTWADCCSQHVDD